jgi:import receptor subunit TOM20
MQSILTINDEQTPSSEKNYACSFYLSSKYSPTFHSGKEKKRVNKSLAESREALAAETEVSEADLRDALKQIKSEPRPATQEARENYFMSQVAMGEQLAARGAF